MRNPCTINIANEFLLNKKQLLGKGATGQVYAAKNLRDNSEVAVKVIDLKSIDNEVTRYLLNMEKIAAMSCDNPHVLRGIKVLQNSLNCFIVTELCNGGTLKNLIKTVGPLGEERSLKFLKQILKGSCSLIGKGIIHRDFKPANILLHNGQAKIIDFGYCQISGYQKPNLDYNVGSPSYMSPEAFLYNEYSQKSQIWAIGVTFYECLNGKTFDQGRNMTEVYKELKCKGLQYKVEVSDKCKTIIKWCLQQQPKRRPTALELLNFVIQHDRSKSSSQTGAQTLRLSLKPVENVQARKKIYEKLGKLTPSSQYFNKDTYKKQEILKPAIQTSYGKVRTVLSSYQPPKTVSQNKIIEKRPTFNPPNSKYQKGIIPFDNKPLVLRHKSQLLQIESKGVCMTDRLKSKENNFYLNSARTKLLPKGVQGHKHRISAHSDFYAMGVQQ